MRKGKIVEIYECSECPFMCIEEGNYCAILDVNFKEIPKEIPKDCPLEDA